MTSHLLLPGVTLKPTSGLPNPAFEPELKEWLEGAVREAEEGDTAASVCHQGAILDLVLSGTLKHAWHEIMNDFLFDGGKPLAYSERFAKRLHRFEAQYHQSTVHAIHTRWWVEGLARPNDVDHTAYAELILAKRQSDGLIYDADVSETVLRHRMKAELTLSMAMGVEILKAAGKLSDGLATELATAITDPRKCPVLGYMSAEYFRLYALRVLGHESLFPLGIAECIAACATDLTVGWGDFAMNSKVDAYMGTAKRTGRDKPIHSPLIACHVAALADTLPVAQRTPVLARLKDYARHLKQQPLDIPAFQMRDVPIPFGTGRTPIEAICASHLIARCQ
jgi:hypothetical protein